MVEKNIRLKTHLGNGVYDTLHPETNSGIVRVGNKNLDETLGEVTAQLAETTNHLDFKEINVYDYAHSLLNDDWSTVIHTIFESNDSGIIKFPVGVFTFKNAIGRIKNNFIIQGINDSKTKFILMLEKQEPYFVRGGLLTGFNDIGIETPKASPFLPFDIININSNALGVVNPSSTKWFDVFNIFYNNDNKNFYDISDGTERLPNLFSIEAQNFDDNGDLNNLCNYIMYQFPYNIRANGVDTVVKFRLRQKGEARSEKVWSTEVTFDNFTVTRMKKGLDIRIENETSRPILSATDIRLKDSSFQGNKAGSFNNPNWPETEFLNIYGDEKNEITVYMDGHNKFWDLPSNGNLENANLIIRGDFFHSAFVKSGVNRKEGFNMLNNSQLDYTGVSSFTEYIKDPDVDDYLISTPYKNGKLIRSNPEKNGYLKGFVYQVFPDKTEIYHRTNESLKSASIVLGNVGEFIVSIGALPILKAYSTLMNRTSSVQRSKWLGANRSQTELGGVNANIDLASKVKISQEVVFDIPFAGVPYVGVSITNQSGGPVIVRNRIVTKTGFIVTFENIGDASSQFVFDWMATGGGY